MFSLIALYLAWRKQDAAIVPVARAAVPAANDRMQAAALPLAA